MYRAYTENCLMPDTSVLLKQHYLLTHLKRLIVIIFLAHFILNAIAQIRSIYCSTFYVFVQITITALQRKTKYSTQNPVVFLRHLQE